MTIVPRVALTRLVDVLLALYVVGLVALLWTGGYRLELGPLTISSTRIGPVVTGMSLLALIRLLLGAGPRDTLVCLASLALSLGVLEGAVRIWNPPMARPSLVQVHQSAPALGWELIPGAQGVGLQGEAIRINSAGMRDIERSRQKTPGFTRIAVIGDSFTFGMAVDAEEAYVHRLERILNRSGRSVEVLNFGVIGYNMWQYLEVFENKVLDFHPDLVVLGFFLDDVRLSTHPELRNPAWVPSNPFATLSGGSNWSALWNLVRNANHLLEVKYRYRRGYRYLQGIEERKVDIGPGNRDSGLYSLYELQTGVADKRLYTEFRQVLAEFSALARHNGIDVLAIHIPDASQLHEPQRQDINGFLASAAAQAAIPLVDLTGEFELAADPRLLYLFPLDAHTSPAGHDIIARTLADALIDAGMLPR